MTPLALRFGLRVNRARKQAGLTRKQLADKAGVHICTVDSVASCQRGASLEVAYRLARALGKSLDELTAEGT